MPAAKRRLPGTLPQWAFGGREAARKYAARQSILGAKATAQVVIEDCSGCNYSVACNVRIEATESSTQGGSHQGEGPSLDLSLLVD